MSSKPFSKPAEATKPAVNKPAAPPATKPAAKPASAPPASKPMPATNKPKTGK